jgi:hypothetical protein
VREKNRSLIRSLPLLLARAGLQIYSNAKLEDLE